MTSTVSVTASADDLSVSTTLDVVTDYVFRGVSLADTAIQPGVEVSKGDFTVGAWFSTPSGQTSIAALDEIDFYASYSLPISDTISTDIGITYYHFPQGGSLFETENGSAGTYEVFLALGLDTVLAPTVTGFYDFTLEAFTLIGTVEHSIPVADKISLDLGGTLGLVDGQDGFSYEYGEASASLGYSFTDDVSAYVGANFTVNSEDALNFRDIVLEGEGDDTLLWFGAGVAAGF